MGDKEAHANAKALYWQKTITLTLSLLSVWFLCSYGCGILWADYLDQYQFIGVPLGFWFAQQGSIFVFCVLISIYVLAMNRLDSNLKSSLNSEA